MITYLYGVKTAAKKYKLRAKRAKLKTSFGSFYFLESGW